MPIFDDAELRRQYDNDPYSLTVQELELLKSADKLNEMIIEILRQQNLTLRPRYRDTD